jgi:glycosyltransferase involved in cell wall biosynthesis
MQLAAGARPVDSDGKTIKDLSIVPIIVDPHEDNAGLLQATELLDQYRTIHNRIYGKEELPNEGFFSVKIETLKEINPTCVGSDKFFFKMQRVSDNKFDKFIGVSKTVCKDFKEWTGKDIELIYNPIKLEKPEKILFLLSATRLTKEKGKDRMLQFAKILDENNIPFLWLVFTDNKKEIKHPNIFFMDPKLDITNYISKADYLVQLSDNVEGYCYTVVESLILGTPVITTKCDVFKEIGIKDGINGFLLNFDMKNVPIDKIYKGLKKFEYEPPKSEWDKYLDNNSKYNPNKKRIVKPIRTYYDMELQKNVKKNDESFEVTQKRANFLVTDLKTVVYDEDK